MNTKIGFGISYMCQIRTQDVMRSGISYMCQIRTQDVMRSELGVLTTWPLGCFGKWTNAEVICPLHFFKIGSTKIEKKILTCDTGKNKRPTGHGSLT